MLEILRSVKDLTLPSPGCIGCWVSEEELHNHIRYSEQWESSEALEAHIRSDLYRRLLAAMELSRKSPEVQFYYTSEKRGFEVIEAARSQATQPGTLSQTR